LRPRHASFNVRKDIGWNGHKNSRKRSGFFNFSLSEWLVYLAQAGFTPTPRSLVNMAPVASCSGWQLPSFWRLSLPSICRINHRFSASWRGSGVFLHCPWSPVVILHRLDADRCLCLIISVLRDGIRVSAGTVLPEFRRNSALHHLR